MGSFNKMAAGAAILSLTASLLLFQNCAKLGIGGSPSGADTKLAGNGYPYEGKILVSKDLCPDNSPYLKIKIENGTGVLLKNNCVILAVPQPINPNDLNLDSLIYNGHDLEVEQVAANKVSFVQNSLTYSSTAAATFTSSPMSSPVTPGNLLICTVLYNSPNGTARTSTVQDNLGNVYSPATPPFGGARAVPRGGFTPEIWYAENVVGGTGHRVTFTFSQTMQPPTMSIRCYEYAGIQRQNSLDRVVYGHNGTDNTIRLSPGSTNWSNELVFVAHWGSQQPPAISGFTERNSSDDGALDYFSTEVLQNFSIELSNEPEIAMAILTFRAID